jgi:GDP-mannose 6-dehydrogenase
MRVTVFGLGYVGCVTAACLAHLGHHVIGVDVQPHKVDAIQRGRAPLIEPELADLIAINVTAGRLRATLDVAQAVAGCDIALVCVGTPSQPNGSVNLSFVERATREIGETSRAREEPPCVVIRSTCPPGTTENLLAPQLRRSAGRAISMAVNPEFMREGSAVRDFFAPPFVLIGADDEAAVQALSALYATLGLPIKITGLRTAEAVKYASNAFHAVKVAFANEIGRWCASQAIDSRSVMDIFCSDRTLNLSEKYLMPGFAFGGSCLPKDLRTLLYEARHADVDLPLLSAVFPSNQLQIQRAFDLIAATGETRIGILGLAFKSGTDDVRESPMVSLVEQLLGKGYTVKIHDPQLSLAAVVGTNRAYLEEHIPHIATLLVASPSQAVESSQVLVIGQPGAALAWAGMNEKIVIDLVGTTPPPGLSNVIRLM